METQMKKCVQIVCMQLDLKAFLTWKITVKQHLIS